MDQSKINSVNSRIHSSTPSAAGSRNIGQLSNYGKPRTVAALHEGDVIKGEITDLRNNEITVTLDDNTNVHAKITNSSNLSIGEFSAFKITEISPRGIVLEAHNNPIYQTNKVIINQALEAAGLPKTEKNVQLVQALLENKLSINKASIFSMQRTLYQFPDTDPQTIAVLTRLRMPMTEENVACMDSYIHHNHQIASQVKLLSSQLPSLLDTLAQNAPANAVADFGKKMIQTIQTSKTPVLSEPTIAFLSATDRETLLTLFQSLQLSDETKANILNGTATVSSVLSYKEDLEFLQKSFSAEDDSLISLESSVENKEETATDAYKPFSQTAKETLANGFSFLQKAAESILTKESSISFVDNPIFTTLEEHMQHFSSQSHQLQNFFTKEQRTEFANTLRSFLLPKNVLQTIENGTITKEQIFHYIKTFLPQADEKSIASLFKNPVFQDLYQDALLSNWSMTPEELQEPGAVTKYYNTLLEQTEHITTLIENTLSGEDASKLLNQTTGIKQNIDFMQTLNDIFTYVQLPVQVKDTIKHGDLYVYANKENLAKKPDKLRLLLHLDMDYLGDTNIHIELNQKHIDTKFYVESEDVKKLIDTNKNILADALCDKGYSFAYESQLSERPVDIVKDYFDADKPEPAIKRYSFDIRC